MTGSVSKGGNEPSQSLQMIERPLMTPDELKSMPKGEFIVMKTGAYPMKVHLKLFFKWGIEFLEPYHLEERAGRKVDYASRDSLMESVRKAYPPQSDKPAERRVRDRDRDEDYLPLPGENDIPFDSLPPKPRPKMRIMTETASDGKQDGDS